MSDARELTKAIVAHGAWKIHLKDAIDTGRSEFTPDKVRSSANCDFGKWLSSLPAADKSSEHFKNVAPLHVQFHEEAAKVLELALVGRKQEAERALTDITSEFVVTSARLVNALMEWKRNS